MRKIDLGDSSDLSNLYTSGFEQTPEHRPKIQRFSYTRPVMKPGQAVAHVRLATTDILFGAVQVFRDGGEVMMHAHAGMDGLWFVLSGRARFYFEDAEPVDLARFEGLCTPRNVKYWFEKIGDDDLEIIQMDAIHPGIRNRVIMGEEDAQKVCAAGAPHVFDAQS